MDFCQAKGFFCTVSSTLINIYFSLLLCFFFNFYFYYFFTIIIFKSFGLRCRDLAMCPNKVTAAGQDAGAGTAPQFCSTGEK